MRLLIFSLTAFMVFSAEAHNALATAIAPEYEIIESIENVKVSGWRMRIRTQQDQMIYDAETVFPGNVVWRWSTAGVYTLDPEVAAKMVPQVRSAMGLYGESRSFKRLVVEIWPVERVQLQFGSEVRPAGQPLILRDQAARDFFEYRGPCESLLTRVLRITGLKP